MAAIGAESSVLFHSGGEPGGDGFMPQRWMRRARLALQEQIVGTLFDMADFQQRTPQREARFLANVVVFAFHRYFDFGAALDLPWQPSVWLPLVASLIRSFLFVIPARRESSVSVPLLGDPSRG